MHLEVVEIDDAVGVGLLLRLLVNKLVVFELDVAPLPAAED